MATLRTATNWSPKYQNEGIHAISVQGFKSLAHESRIEIRPLTILAGANSSGKSSIMQPLLLMKQTLEASYDAGPLLLNGPNVKFTSSDQFASRLQDERDRQTFSVEMENPEGVRHKTAFTQARGKTLEIQHMLIDENGERCLRLTPGQTTVDLECILSTFLPEMKEQWNNPPDGYQLAVARDRCFLLIGFGAKSESSFRRLSFSIFPNSMFPSRELHRMIHVPGLPGTPERSYVRAASGPPFVGTFERYFATVIAEWQNNNDVRLRRLEAMLADLGLTGAVLATHLNDTQIELQVGRLLEVQPSGSDLVNITDVGFGVSQVLPVLVALLVAEKGQLVYIEQPELHLHPRAQYELARVIAETAERGVRLVVETHSAMLLLRVQTLIARGDLDPNLVKLHWFTRDPVDGVTSINSTDLDGDGAFGEWPEDFGEVELMAEAAYLDAVEGHSRD